MVRSTVQSPRKSAQDQDQATSKKEEKVCHKRKWDLSTAAGGQRYKHLAQSMKAYYEAEERKDLQKKCSTPGLMRDKSQEYDEFHTISYFLQIEYELGTVCDRGWVSRTLSLDDWYNRVDEEDTDKQGNMIRYATACLTDHKKEKSGGCYVCVPQEQLRHILTLWSEEVCYGERGLPINESRDNGKEPIFCQFNGKQLSDHDQWLPWFRRVAGIPSSSLPLLAGGIFGT